MSEHVEQATAAPGEKRQLPIHSMMWFTREIAESLGIGDQYDRIQSISIHCDVKRPVMIEMTVVAHGE